jgi:3-dehydrosphinganine reductase
MFCEIVLGALGLVSAVVYFVASKNKRERIDLRGKHVVVTGGSMGIGLDIAIEAFKQGAHVSIIARNRVI